MRFSEAIALTPADFDFSHQLLSVNKTWNYKDGGGFQPTKNKSSVRKIQLDWMIVSQFSALVKDLPVNEPIFVEKAIFNSTINNILNRHCTDLGIPVITIHGLRHPYVKPTTKKFASFLKFFRAAAIAARSCSIRYSWLMLPFQISPFLKSPA